MDLISRMLPVSLPFGIWREISEALCSNVFDDAELAEARTAKNQLDALFSSSPTLRNSQLVGTSSDAGSLQSYRGYLFAFKEDPKGFAHLIVQGNHEHFPYGIDVEFFGPNQDLPLIGLHKLMSRTRHSTQLYGQLAAMGVRHLIDDCFPNYIAVGDEMAQKLLPSL